MESKQVSPETDKIKSEGEHCLEEGKLCDVLRMMGGGDQGSCWIRRSGKVSLGR